REAAMPAVNAKLSEYQAAVGLAGLDEWSEVRSEWAAVAEAYRKVLAESNGLLLREGFGQSWVSSTCVVSLTNFEASRLAGALADAEIETRQWWGKGAHAHRATAELPRTSLPATEELARSTIALPYFRDLGPGEIRRVVEAIRAARNADDWACLPLSQLRGSR